MEIKKKSKYVGPKMPRPQNKEAKSLGLAQLVDNN
jgi:hypothetical protein